MGGPRGSHPTGRPRQRSRSSGRRSKSPNRKAQPSQRGPGTGAGGAGQSSQFNQFFSAIKPFLLSGAAAAAAASIAGIGSRKDKQAAGTPGNFDL
jgi:hypothetical protein